MAKHIELAPILGTLTANSWNAPAKGLTKTQWEKCGEKLTEIGGAASWWLGDWWAYNDQRKYGDGKKLAESVGVDYGSVMSYASVCRAFQFSRRLENLSFGHHDAVMVLKGEALRDKWLKIAAEKGWSIKEFRLALLREKKRLRHSTISANSRLNDLSNGRFALIYADPPWKFETHSELGQEMTSPDLHYPTMSIEDIQNLDVQGRHMEDVADDDAALYLWCTSANLPLALTVVAAWGFEYSTHAVWDKQRSGTGYIFLNQHEILIYAKRGNMPAPLYIPSSIFSYPREKHSAKPREIRNTLEKMYPEFGPHDRLEMFARGDVPGWTVWGNEAE